jgi:hypothetical protein
MDNLAICLLCAILIGLGATLTFDLWAQFLKYLFKITPSNICLVGRWIRYMPKGIFIHSNISVTPKKRGECIVGWFSHYIIGISFAVAFVLIVGNNWLHQPTLIPAIVFGIGTVAAPLFIMQPAFGFGFASTKTSKPMQAIIRSVMNHSAFGVGLYVFALLFN